MKKNSILPLLLAGVISASCVGTGYAIARSLPKAAAATAEFQVPLVRAVHYFQNASPMNFWNALNLAAVPGDFARIRADGFDTVVIVVPWPEFQPKVNSDSGFNEEAYRRLQAVTKAARDAKLKVILRLGYAWSLSPDNDLFVYDRLTRVFHDDRLHAKWLAFMEETCKRVCNDPNVLFGFISWEDLYPNDITGTAPPRDNAALNAKFAEFLKARYTLEGAARELGEPLANWSQVRVPPRKHPSYKLMLEYWDDALATRFFGEGQKRFPRLSMEARLDADPYWTAEGKIDWHRHIQTYRQPATPVVTTYYSIAWGMKNEGDEVSADEALKMFGTALKSMKEQVGDRQIFVDQFQYFDNTPQFSRNTKIRDAELASFIVKSADVFINHHATPGLWQYRDYPLTAIYNPSFEMGTAGWKFEGDTALADAADGGKALQLSVGAKLQQSVNAIPVWHGNNPQSADAQLCVRLRADKPADLRLAATINGTPVATLAATADGQRSCQAVKIPQQLQLALTLQGPAGGKAWVDDVELYTHVQLSRMYDLDNRPGPSLEAIRELNRRLANRPTAAGKLAAR